MKLVNRHGTSLCPFRPLFNLTVWH
jgi:hypothetical protein